MPTRIEHGASLVIDLSCSKPIVSHNDVKIETNSTRPVLYCIHKVSTRPTRVFGTINQYERTE